MVTSCAGLLDERCETVTKAIKSQTDQQDSSLTRITGRANGVVNHSSPNSASGGI